MAFQALININRLNGRFPARQFIRTWKYGSIRFKASISASTTSSSGKTSDGGKNGKNVMSTSTPPTPRVLPEFSPAVDNVYKEIMRVLQNRRHQLKAKIKLMREEEAATPKKRSRAGKQAPLPVEIDPRLDFVLRRHRQDSLHLSQDHLQNVSDFRIQDESALKPAVKNLPVVPAVPVRPAPAKQKKAVPAEAGVKPVSKKQKMEEERKVARCESDATVRELILKHINASLKSYILACAHIDMVKPILQTVGFYRDQYPAVNDRKKIIDISTYNLLLNIYAKQGKLPLVKELFHSMKIDGILPNAKSFALALETLAREESIDVKTAKKIIRQMQDENISVNDIFTQCSFIMDERDLVLKVIHTVRPNFQPAIPYPDQPYQPAILEPLNFRPTVVMKDTPYRTVLSNHGQTMNLFREQLEREKRGVITIQSVDALEEPNERVRLYRKKMDNLKGFWRQTLTAAVERNMEMLKGQQRGRRHITIYPYLCTLPTAELVELLVEEMVRLAQGSQGYSASTFVLHMQLGQKVLNRYLVDCKEKYQLVEQMEKTYGEYLKYFEDKQITSIYNCRQYWEKVEHDLKLSVRADLRDHLWPKSVLIRVGQFLYDIMISDVKMDVTLLRQLPLYDFVPAVYKVAHHEGLKLKEQVRPHPVLAKLYKGSMPETLNFDTDMCPTIVPPQPWLSSKTGGYLLQKTTFTRLPDMTSGQECIIDNVPTKQISPILDSLNQLGASPWIVNKSMLDLIIKVFKNNGMPEVDIPAPVSTCPALPKVSRELTDEEKSRIWRQRFLLKKKRGEMFSLWCDALYKLSIANHFRDSVFYFPQNIDFRGRVYPVPPHFQHLGGDMSRSMLLFAKGMPLGEHGLDWLKIHLINLTGLKKKSSLPDRLAYANEMLDDILDSADNPLTGRGWWKGSDDPWQTLACSMEIAKAIRSGNPATFVSHFPVHQDGSCNGLQHYAALGRDQKGAVAVNLCPMDTPQDVYSGVAALVEQAREKDAQSGIEVAKTLEGFIGRKVVKQTVMTIVYGVTKYGAKAQIQGQLADIKTFPAEKTWPAAAYVAGKTFDSIKQMFTSARQIQEWFVNSAKIISSARNKPVEWITPLGLPVLQPYFKTTTHNNNRQAIHLAVDPKPNGVKQKNAFPPNFVHSLDSSHMMLTCLHAARAGISFAAVHDSYWTHPANVDIMNKLTREQFVALHSLPILDDLSSFMVQRFGFDSAGLVQADQHDPRVVLNRILTDVPEKGKFDLKSVLKSVFFFS